MPIRQRESSLLKSSNCLVTFFEGFINAFEWTNPGKLRQKSDTLLAVQVSSVCLVQLGEMPSTGSGPIKSFTVHCFAGESAGQESRPEIDC
ncbi:hypothetical protein JTB14_009726 [Gonioctena quinquepunctata]|nr:hypothetical protein JTB14_009726 [Gonioctena quinquepunctata]